MKQKTRRKQKVGEKNLRVREGGAAYSAKHDYLNVVHLANCENMGAVPDESVHLTVTSPPYWNAIDYTLHAGNGDALNYRHRKTGATYEGYLDFLRRCFTEVKRVHAPGSFVCVVIGTVLEKGRHIPLPFHFTAMMEDVGFEFHQDILWHKCTAGVKRAGVIIQKPFPGYFYPNIMTEYILVFRKKGGEPLYRRSSDATKEKSKISINSLFTRDIANNLWNIPPVPPNTIPHPCPFPEEVPHRLIQLYSCVGDTVLDPYAGAGTTLKVAHALKRNFIGYEIEERYVQSARDFILSPLKIRQKQIVLEYKKIGLDEYMPPKNVSSKRTRKTFPSKEMLLVK